MTTNREQWFLDRIGKRVWRNKTSCTCKTCANVYGNGVIISDDTHAFYLYAVESESNGEDVPLKYFDTPEERNAFEQSLNNQK